MKTKFYFTIISFVFFIGLNAQTNLNEYKYVLVPIKFDFLKTADQYQLNSLTKFLLEKENFTTYFDDDVLPEDLVKDRCLALEANVLNESKLFKTKLKVQLQDCKKNIIVETQVGDSKIKQYEKAYHEALREAFQSFKAINYTYNPKLKKEVIDGTKKPKVAEVKKTNNNTGKIVKVDKESKPSIMPKVTKSDKNIKPKNQQPIKETKDLSSSGNEILYAQSINNGFQLVDKTPKVVYTIFHSGKKDIFIVKGIDALIYKMNDIWVISKMVNDTLQTESINIKF